MTALAIGGIVAMLRQEKRETFLLLLLCCVISAEAWFMLVLWCADCALLTAALHRVLSLLVWVCSVCPPASICVLYVTRFLCIYFCEPPISFVWVCLFD